MSVTYKIDLKLSESNYLNKLRENLESNFPLSQRGLSNDNQVYYYNSNLSISIDRDKISILSKNCIIEFLDFLYSFADDKSIEIEQVQYTIVTSFLELPNASPIINPLVEKKIVGTYQGYYTEVLILISARIC